MTRSSIDPLYAFDPEIELTLHRLRKIRNATVNTSSCIDSAIDSNQFYTDNFVSRISHSRCSVSTMVHPISIAGAGQTYELKSGLIHLLPKFHGFAGEDPHKRLKEFHVVCSTIRPQGISEDYI
ncbi:hypothetical protein CR513_47789, partial [Mucuna pruriens]